MNGASQTGSGGSTGGGSGGSGSGGAGSGGGGGGSGGASSGGAGGQTDAAVSTDGVEVSTPTCPDLDANGVPDCLETLVTNGTFNHDAAGWLPEFAAAQAFNSQDAEGAPTSGSLQITNSSSSVGPGNLAITGSSQCIAAVAGVNYAVYAQGFVVAAAGASGIQAGIGLRFFTTADCSGPGNADAYLTMLASTPGAWKLIKGAAVTPAATRSISVRLLIQKPYDQAPASARFDDVLVKRK